MDRTMAKSGSIKVALCQIFALDGDREGNFIRIENAVREAKGKEAQIACFPESIIHGWVNPDSHQRACPIPGEDSDRLCQLAIKYSLFLCVGLDEKAGGDLYGSALLIDNKGKILLKHRKTNVLPELMTPPYQTGNEIQAVDTPLGRIGLLICADTFVPENLRRMAELKPDLVLVPYGWAAKEEDWPEHGKELHKVVSNAAKTIGALVVGTDLVGEITHGPWSGQVYGGQSVAADSQGTLLAIGKDRDRDILIVELHLGSTN